MPIANGKLLSIINGIATHILINQCYSIANKSQSCNIKLLFKCNQNVVIQMKSTQSYKWNQTESGSMMKYSFSMINMLSIWYIGWKHSLYICCLAFMHCLAFKGSIV